MHHEKIVRVFIVEDSPLVRQFLVEVLNRTPGIEVIGTANNGDDAIREVERTKPDVITMDIQMPNMNGFDTTRRIMETCPTPIVIVSGMADATSKANAFKAVEAGAIGILETPHGPGHPQHHRSVAELVRTVKLMSEVRVVRRWPRSRRGDVAPLPLGSEYQFPTAQVQPRLIAIGASTGGPPVIQTILSDLPRTFPIPIVLVQHIAAGFTNGFVEWLRQCLSLPVELPTHGQYLTPGTVYVAPEGVHLRVASGGSAVLSTDVPENGLRPSVSSLFRSVADVYGRAAVGVLLTGMGKDGALELMLMKERGAMTIAQDRRSSVVHGMPGEAIRLGGATHVLSPEKIQAVLASLTVPPSTRQHNTNERDYA